MGDDFNEVQYLANYADLQAAFGSGSDLATQRFITNGLPVRPTCLIWTGRQRTRPRGQRP